MIIAFLGSSLNQYRENFLIYIDQLDLACPFCSSRVHFHDYYERKIRFGDHKESITILRVQCAEPNYKRTHAVLPDFLCPYKHYPACEIETVEEEFEQGTPKDRIESPASPSTIKRWIDYISNKKDEVVGALLSLLYKYYGITESLMHTVHSHLLQRLQSLISKLPTIDCSELIIGTVNIWLTSLMSGLFL